MSEKCDICGGTGRVYTDLGFGVTVEPCPKCNKAYRRHMDELTRANKGQKAQKEVRPWIGE